MSSVDQAWELWVIGRQLSPFHSEKWNSFVAREQIHLRFVIIFSDRRRLRFGQSVSITLSSKLKLSQRNKLRVKWVWSFVNMKKIIALFAISAVLAICAVLYVLYAIDRAEVTRRWQSTCCEKCYWIFAYYLYSFPFLNQNCIAWIAIMTKQTHTIGQGLRKWTV